MEDVEEVVEDVVVEDEEILVLGPPGFLNSCGDGELLELDPIALTLVRCEEEVAVGAGLAGTPSIPINLFGSSNRCFTRE